MAIPIMAYCCSSMFVVKFTGFIFVLAAQPLHHKTCESRLWRRYKFDEVLFWRQSRHVLSRNMFLELPAKPYMCLSKSAALNREALMLRHLVCEQGLLTPEHLLKGFHDELNACRNVGWGSHETDQILNSLHDIPVESTSQCNEFMMHAAKQLAGAAFRDALLSLGVRRFGNHCQDSACALILLLKELAGGVADKRLQAAEIGVHKGQTSVRLLRTLPSLQLVLVDPYSSYSTTIMHKCSTSKETPAEIQKEMRLGIQPFIERTNLYIAESVTTAAHIPDGSLDLVFIDANHSREALRADILAWTPKVRSGGFITGDDWNHRYPGVNLAVLEFFSPASLMLGADALWIARKA
eukprot:gnl/TRDRNA2_/TRDRNA2_205239_c0_seq1.p1 gnl/TRDRNA2_/TRDRNA2_205239_c0~~gnl/TRDRNA2_/TRDRNA2_205239_c0_seq1.p1  ORF type:complete len:352 (-),score=31.58 gnl/TRDRNA2_/TRDRNA2_205239_c0_seq1:36-1091(-)